MPRSCTELQRGHCACDSSQSLPMLQNGMTWSSESSSFAPTQGTRAPTPSPLQSTQEWEHFGEENICFVLKSHLWCTREKAGLYVNQSLELTYFKSPTQAFSLEWISEVCRPSSSSKLGHLWHQTMLLKPLSRQLLKATSKSLSGWFLSLPACPHGQQIALCVQPDSCFSFQL